MAAHVTAEASSTDSGTGRCVPALPVFSGWPYQDPASHPVRFGADGPGVWLDADGLVLPVADTFLWDRKKKSIFDHPILASV